MPLTTRIDIPVAQRLEAICNETGLALSILMEKMLLYALDHMELVEVRRKDIAFKEVKAE